VRTGLKEIHVQNQEKANECTGAEQMNVDDGDVNMFFMAATRMTLDNAPADSQEHPTIGMGVLDIDLGVSPSIYNVLHLMVGWMGKGF
jgi:hypothetical protein